MGDRSQTKSLTKVCGQQPSKHQQSHISKDENGAALAVKCQDQETILQSRIWIGKRLEDQSKHGEISRTRSKVGRMDSTEEYCLEKNQMVKYYVALSSTGCLKDKIVSHVMFVGLRLTSDFYQPQKKKKSPTIKY